MTASGPLELLVKLLAPDASAGAYNDWRLVATTTLPAWALAAIGLCLLVAARGRRPWRSTSSRTRAPSRPSASAR